jgi:hypothetical protein
MARRIRGPEREREGGWEETGGYRKLYNEDLLNLYSSPNIIRMIKSRKTSWEGHVARIEDMRTECKILLGKQFG